jgi:hypothetical protein
MPIECVTSIPPEPVTIKLLKRNSGVCVPSLLWKTAASASNARVLNNSWPFGDSALKSRTKVTQDATLAPETVGESVGESVGRMVGDSDGDSVGDDVGADDGDTVGDVLEVGVSDAVVGEVLGLSVGDSVG